MLALLYAVFVLVQCIRVFFYYNKKWEPTEKLTLFNYMENSKIFQVYSTDEDFVLFDNVFG